MKTLLLRLRHRTARSPGSEENGRSGQASRNFIAEAYKETGVTPALRNLYERYRMNEARRKAAAFRNQQEFHQ